MLVQCCSRIESTLSISAVDVTFGLAEWHCGWNERARLANRAKHMGNYNSVVCLEINLQDQYIFLIFFINIFENDLFSPHFNSSTFQVPTKGLIIKVFRYLNFRVPNSSTLSTLCEPCCYKSDLGSNSICFLSNALIQPAWSARWTGFTILGLFLWFHSARANTINRSSK